MKNIATLGRVRISADGLGVVSHAGMGSNPNIYAIGDATFPQKFTHAANATARLVIANALDGAHRPARELVIPHCTYTDPEVAGVGLTPRRARNEGVAIDAYRLDLAKVPRGRSHHRSGLRGPARRAGGMPRRGGPRQPGR